MDTISNQMSYKTNKFLKIDSDSSKYHLYLKGIDGKFLECNTAQAKSFGLSKGSDVVGRFDEYFLPKEEAELVKENEKEIIKIGLPKIFVEDCSFCGSSPERMISFKMPIASPTKQHKLIGVFGISVSMNNLDLIAGETLNPFQNLFVMPKINDDITFASKNLSKRQKECLKYLASGMTAKKIARILNLSPRTVEFYIENLKKKFLCSNRTELIAKAFSIFNH
jgi:DNA-binding CsgD family transcriptional regulator